MVSIETAPYKRGIDVSAIGMQASSAIKRVMTSSKGCISPICLLPIMRITASRATKMIAVLRKISPIHAVCGGEKNLFRKRRRSACKYQKNVL